MPTAIDPVAGLVRSSVDMAILKPSPSAPSRCAAGIAQSVKCSATVGEARMPSLRSFLPTSKPGVPFSTRNAVIPFARLAGSTVANTVMTSAWSPLVHHCLEPLST